MTEDFYDLLDVPTDATQKQVKRAFREKVRIYHPDRNDDERARAQFTAVKKAYDILDDPVERRAYDRLGHEDYVAKRTKGLPSPDVWRSTSDDDSGSNRGSRTDRSASSRTASTTATGTAGSGRNTDASATETTAGARSDGGAATARRRAGSTTGDRAPTASAAGEHPIGRWWRRRNVAGPLLWIATLTYVAGLGHFVSANAAGLAAFRDALLATSGEPASVLDALVTDRHGVDSPVEFVAETTVVSPPAALEPGQWYGLLVGIVGLTVLALVAARLLRRVDLRSRISIEETIVLAAAVALSAGLAGGPLLAGSLLLPLLFGVVVHRTHRLPGWSPSYAYVLAVSAPTIGLLAGLVGAGSLGTDVLAFGILAPIGALGLPLRVAVRKRRRA